MTRDQYPTIVLEDAETWLDWLRDYAGATLSDIEAAVNQPPADALKIFEREDGFAKNLLVLACLNWLYIRIVEFYPQNWPPETERMRLADLPPWVYELYQRANECEVWS